MFCPKCGRRNEGDYKFCRGCGENLKAVAKAMERRWVKLLYRPLDAYIRSQNRNLPKRARNFRRFWWVWLTFAALYAAQGLWDGDADWWLGIVIIPILLAGLWDYVIYRRSSDSGSNDNKPLAEAVSLPDSLAELASAPTTNELATPFSVTEPTTRRLEPLAAEKRSGDLM